MKPRNPFAIVVKKRRAGSHRKSTKALRKQAKQIDYRGEALMVKQRAFNSQNSDRYRAPLPVYIKIFSQSVFQYKLPIVQGIEPQPSKLLIQVRVLVGGPVWKCSLVGRAGPSYGQGRGFESLHFHQIALTQQYFCSIIMFLQEII